MFYFILQYEELHQYQILCHINKIDINNIVRLCQVRLYTEIADKHIFTGRDVVIINVGTPLI